MINSKSFLANVLIIFLVGFNPLWSQNNLSIISWNIENFGKTKDDNEIRQIATILKEFDIVAIQEVVAIDPGGAQAVARLADQLNRMGSKWDYSISDPTNSPSRKTERYAFLWKTSQVTSIGRPWLASQYAKEIFRDLNDRKLLKCIWSAAKMEHFRE